MKFTTAKGQITLTLDLGTYTTQNHQETLAQPLGRLSICLWTTYYQTPGFMSEAISRGPHAAEEEGPESKKQDWNVRRQHHE